MTCARVSGARSQEARAAHEAPKGRRSSEHDAIEKGEGA